MDKIQEKVMALFDREVAQLSQADYKEVLENVISDLEARLDCVREELAVEGDDN